MIALVPDGKQVLCSGAPLLADFSDALAGLSNVSQSNDAEVACYRRRIHLGARLNAYEVTPEVLASDSGRAATHAVVEYHLARVGKSVDEILHERNRLLGRVQALLALYAQRPAVVSDALFDWRRRNGWLELKNRP
jgi:hypothetical protein